jgi:hypothetical protein
MGLVPSIYVNSEYPLKLTPPESLDEKFTKLVVTIMLSAVLLIVWIVRNLF